MSEGRRSRFVDALSRVSRVTISVTLTMAKQEVHNDATKRCGFMSVRHISRVVIESIANGIMNTISVNAENSEVESNLLTKDSENM